jgi:GAF domain-containing protein
VVPLSANVIFLFVLKQSFILDPTPFTLLVTGITFALGLFRFQLLDVVPAARDAVIEGMGDAVLVLDVENRIVDLNPAAQRVLGQTAADLIGHPAREALAAYGDLLDRYGGLAQGQAEIGLGTAGHFDMRLSTMHDRHGQSTGRLIVLRDITDRRCAEQALERWVRQFQVVSEVAHEIAAGHELDDLLGRVARLVQDRFAAYQVAIYLASDEGQQVTVGAASGEGSEELLGGSWPEHVLSGAVGDLLRRGVSHVASGPESGAVYIGGASTDTRSEVALPLRIGQRTIGALDMYITAGERFDETALAVLQAVADQLAIAVENARLLEQMASSVREMEHMYREQDREAWRSLTGRAGQTLGYRYRQQRVELAGEIGPAAEQALQQGRSFVTRTEDVVAVPIVLRNQTIGALDLHFQRGQGTSEEIALVQEVANRLALTLESARLYEDTQRSAARERTIGEITARIRESLDMDAVLSAAVRELGEALPGTRVQVRLGTGPTE